MSKQLLQIERIFSSTAKNHYLLQSISWQTNLIAKLIDSNGMQIDEHNYTQNIDDNQFNCWMNYVIYLKTTFQNFFGFSAANGAMDSDFFITTNAEWTHGVTSFGENWLLASQLFQHLNNENENRRRKN